MIDQDDDVTAALRLIGRRANYDGRELCPRCTSRYTPAGADLCVECRDELDRSSRAVKRRWWNERRGRGVTRLEGAVVWLRTELRGGPRTSREIKRRASAAGITLSTLQRARAQLDVTVVRRGNGPDHGTTWQLTRLNEAPDGTSQSARSTNTGDAT